VPEGSNLISWRQPNDKTMWDGSLCFEHQLESFSCIDTIPECNRQTPDYGVYRAMHMSRICVAVENAIVKEGLVRRSLNQIKM